jgi:hypothetical protein
MEADGRTPPESGGARAEAARDDRPAAIRRPVLATLWIAVVLAAAAWPLVHGVLAARLR